MTNSNEIMVTVPLERYEQLLEAEVNLNTLTEGLFGTAELDYTGKGLRFTADAETVARAVCPLAYNSTVKELQKARQELVNGKPQDKSADDF